MITKWPPLTFHLLHRAAAAQRGAGPAVTRQAGEGIGLRALLLFDASPLRKRHRTNPYASSVFREICERAADLEPRAAANVVESSCTSDVRRDAVTGQGRSELRSATGPASPHGSRSTELQKVSGP